MDHESNARLRQVAAECPLAHCDMTKTQILNTIIRLQWWFLFDQSKLWPNHCSTWWSHQMETFVALVAICAGNSPVTGEFPAKGQWRGTLMLFFIWAWINGWVNNRKTVDLTRHRAYYDVIVLYRSQYIVKPRYWSTALLSIAIVFFVHNSAVSLEYTLCRPRTHCSRGRQFGLPLCNRPAFM